MYARFKLLAAVAIVSLAATASQAADYAPPPCYDAATIAAGRAPPGAVPCYVPPPPVVEEFGGWYLRGYVGMSNQQATLNHPAFSERPYTHVDDGFDSAPFFGAGIGYYFNDWLRFDITGEYRGSANYHGYGTYPGGSDEYRGRKKEWVGLVNAYADLGTWNRLTPFVGAGVGFAYNTISSFMDVNTPTGGVYYAQSGSKFNFAWALHAGVAYKVTPNFSVELAYRYLNLGKAETGTGQSFDGTNANGRPFTFDKLVSHDIMLGLRFNLDSVETFSRPAPVYYVPPPVYTPPPVYVQPPLQSRG
ncbi:MAG TPA: outer membrane protein [Pseudolabrys sp.]|nr:outer membrane protein [Pseudolabrys sp.]